MEKHVQVLDLSHKRHTYAVGDIQGSFDLLEEKLEALGFDKEQDALIAVGDLIDRGGQSFKALQYLRKDWFYAVKGNHEDFAVLGAFDSYYANQHKKNGGEWFYRLDEDSRYIYASEFEKLPVALELHLNGRKYGFTHADVLGNDWNAFTAQLRAYPESIAHKGSVLFHALWSRSRARDWFTGFDESNHSPILGVDEVYVGHTPFDEALSVHNINYIDTKAYESGKFTIVQVGTRVPQAPLEHYKYSTEEFWES